MQNLMCRNFIPRIVNCKDVVYKDDEVVGVGYNNPEGKRNVLSTVNRMLMKN